MYMSPVIRVVWRSIRKDTEHWVIQQQKQLTVLTTVNYVLKTERSILLMVNPITQNYNVDIKIWIA